MATEEGRKAARIAAQREIARSGLDGVALGARAKVHPQTVQAFLAGKRWPELRTLGKLDVALGWPAGTLATIAEGGEVPPNLAGPLSDPRSDTVRATPDTEGALLFMRPDGVDDDEWESIKRDAEGYLQWQIEKALRERGS